MPAISIIFSAAVLFADLPAVPTSLPATPNAQSIFQDQVTAIEADLATYLQRRLDSAGPQLAFIDYQIDLRLLQRWMLNRAADPKAEEELQACIALRAINLQTVGDQISQRLQVSALTPSQLDGLTKLHKLTYALPDETTIAQIDEVFRNLAPALILAANATPAEVKNLPPMRPKPLGPPPPPPAAGPPTPADLTARAKQVQVSMPLKRQLLALAAATSAAADASAAEDPKSQDHKAHDEATLLFRVLSGVVDLSEGLEKNTGVDTVTRAKLEQQLTEALALFTDVRTRSTGKRRLSTLGQYRETVARVQQLQLPPALLQKLAPAFVWVNNNPDASAKILEAIDRYAHLCAFFDARREPPGVAANYHKTLDGLAKLFISQRAAVLDDAAQLANASVFSSVPANMVSHVETMRQVFESISLLDRLPRALQVLNIYHPRPGGALEKRAGTVATELSVNAGVLAAREPAIKFCADVERLALIAETLAPPAGIPVDILKMYTAGKLGPVENRRSAIIGELASDLASSRDLDPSLLAKLDVLHMLYDSLRSAGEIETSLARCDNLSRWADWSINPAQLRALVNPYRDATAAAFDGFAIDNATPVFRWPDVYKRFAPILALVKEVGLYADQVSTLPTGLPGEFSKLLTPMDNQPFAVERYASFAIGVWQRAAEATDAKTADPLFDAMLVKLRKELLP